MDGWLDRQTDKWIGHQIERWMDGWMDGWMGRGVYLSLKIVFSVLGTPVCGCLTPLYKPSLYNGEAVCALQLSVCVGSMCVVCLRACVNIFCVCARMCLCVCMCMYVCLTVGAGLKM